MAVVSSDQLDYHYRLLSLPPRERGHRSTLSEIQQAYQRKVAELELVRNLCTPYAIRVNFPRLYAAFLALKNAALHASLDAAQHMRSCEESEGEAAASTNANVTMEDMHVATDGDVIMTDGDIKMTDGDVIMEDVTMGETDDFMAGLERTLGAMKLF